MSEFIYRIDQAVKASLPVASCFLLILLASAPWPPLLKSLIQALPLMLLCFWVMHRPDLFGVGWSFFLGLISDMLAGHIVGLTAFSFLLADLLLRRERGFFRHHSFLASWLTAGLVIMGCSLLPWLLAGIFFGRFSDPAPIGVHIAFSLLLFPVVAGVIPRFSALPREEF